MKLLRIAAVSLAALCLTVVALAMAAPTLFTSVDPLITDVVQRLRPPSGEHPFGTDQSGRDVFARVVHGARQSVGVGLLATGVALVVGVVIGTLVGVAPRAVDAVVMRVLDVLLALPEFLIALVVVALLGPGATNLALAVTIAAAPVYVRYARAHTRALRREEYVEAARLIGVGPLRVLVTHIAPSVLRRLSVLAALGVGTSILAISGLSFLGLGVGEPTPEWGLILSEGRNVLGTAWWVTVFPGLAITLTVVSVGYLGRLLRSRIDGGAS